MAFCSSVPLRLVQSMLAQPLADVEGEDGSRSRALADYLPTDHGAFLVCHQVLQPLDSGRSLLVFSFRHFSRTSLCSPRPSNKTFSHRFSLFSVQGQKACLIFTQFSPLRTCSTASGYEFWLPVGCQFQGGQYQPV